VDADGRDGPQIKEIRLMNMEMTFPDDAQQAHARSDRNLSEYERWASIVAGAGLAVYGLTRLKRNGWLHAGIGALLLRRGVTAHCDVYEALGMNTAADAADTRAALRGSRGVNVLESVTINRPIAELYRFWRNLENLPRFMSHLESVERITDTLSRWRARGPAGTTVEWNAEIINEVTDQVIGWRSIENSDVVSAGSVNFEEVGEGRTRVRVRLQYSPPGGKLGDAVARLMGSDAATEIRQDLDRFKQLVESNQRV
jgi:uncharacterized membrane protein